MTFEPLSVTVTDRGPAMYRVACFGMEARFDHKVRAKKVWSDPIVLPANGSLVGWIECGRVVLGPDELFGKRLCFRCLQG